MPEPPGLSELALFILAFRAQGFESGAYDDMTGGAYAGLFAGALQRHAPRSPA